MAYALRAAGDPLPYVKTVREIVHQADSRIPVVAGIALPCIKGLKEPLRGV